MHVREALLEVGIRNNTRIKILFFQKQNIAVLGVDRLQIFHKLLDISPKTAPTHQGSVHACVNANVHGGIVSGKGKGKK